MTKQDNTRKANTGIDPKDYFDGLEGKFPAIPVRPAFRVKAGEWVTVTSPFFVKQEVMAEQDSWLVCDSLDRRKLLASLDGLELIPLSDVRKMSLPAGILPESIWEGESYRGLLGMGELAPRRGRVLLDHMEGRWSFRTSNVVTGAGKDRNWRREFFGKVLIRTVSFMGFKLQDGGIFLDEELFELFFGEGIPDGIALIKDGELFEAAVAPYGATLCFGDNAYYPVKKGDVVFVNKNAPDGIEVDSPHSFVKQYATLA